VFQSFNLLPYLSVTANVMLPLQFSPVRRERLAGVSAQEEALRLIRALGLADPDIQERPVHQLSMGQQQRVAAARALIGRPELLIADEPTSSLDADTRAEFLRLLMAECAQFGTSVLFVSHDRALSDLFDRSIALRDINQTG
jgi:putative ABC transport system ATP-binding protein